MELSWWPHLVDGRPGGEGLTENDKTLPRFAITPIPNEGLENLKCLQLQQDFLQLATGYDKEKRKRMSRFGPYLYFESTKLAFFFESGTSWKKNTSSCLSLDFFQKTPLGWIVRGHDGERRKSFLLRNYSYRQQWRAGEPQVPAASARLTPAGHKQLAARNMSPGSAPFSFYVLNSVKGRIQKKWREIWKCYSSL